MSVNIAMRDVYEYEVLVVEFIIDGKEVHKIMGKYVNYYLSGDEYIYRLKNGKELGTTSLLKDGGKGLTLKEAREYWTIFKGLGFKHLKSSGQ
jgi:hypothetical protein